MSSKQERRHRGTAFNTVRGLLLATVLAALGSIQPGEIPDGPVVQLELLESQLCRPSNRQKRLVCHIRTGTRSKLTFRASGSSGDDLMAEAILANGAAVPLEISSSFSSYEIDLGQFDHRMLEIRVYSKAGAALNWRAAELRGETEELIAPLHPLLDKKLRRPNILLYLVDTLRASRMSLYGYDRDTTPRLEEFAKRAIVFDNAYSNGADTRAGIPALLASGTPNMLRGHMRKVDGQPSATIAELLKRRGYRTGAFQANPTMSRSLGFARGFDRYRIFKSEERGQRVKTAAPALHQEALEWIQADRRFPFFAYIQTMDVHNPYDAPPPFRNRYFKGPTERPLPDTTGLDKEEAWRLLEIYKTLEPDRYDECVAYADHILGELLDQLEELGYAENTIIIITSDHGESLGAGARYPHGASLEEGIVRIPLVIYLPWAAHHRRIKDVTSLVDVAPTIADLVNLRPPNDYVGRSLFRPRTKHRPSYALGERNLANQSIEWFLREGAWKLVLSGDQSELFYMTRDPTASEDVSAQFPATTQYLARRIGAMDQRGGGQRPGKEGLGLSEAQMEEVHEALRALGYD